MPNWGVGQISAQGGNLKKNHNCTGPITQGTFFRCLVNLGQNSKNNKHTGHTWWMFFHKPKRYANMFRNSALQSSNHLSPLKIRISDLSYWYILKYTTTLKTAWCTLIQSPQITPSYFFSCHISISGFSLSKLGISTISWGQNLISVVSNDSLKCI